MSWFKKVSDWLGLITVRNRDAKGRYVADDLSTSDKDEAYITSIPNAQMMELTLKLNKVDITAIVKDFERYEYKVTASYKEEEADSDFSERYESLMRFLNP